jgi:hypothetical protein
MLGSPLPERQDAIANAMKHARRQRIAEDAAITRRAQYRTGVDGVQNSCYTAVTTPGAENNVAGFLFGQGLIRAAILIDACNLLGALARAGLGYPALGPLIELLRGKDDPVFARFYAAPPPEEPWKGWFLAMQRANRHIEGLEFFQGYRTPDRKEKVIDVALAVDLIEGIFENRFDRADVFGGDGDHLYALKVAHEKQRARIRVHLAPGQRLYAVGKARIPFTMWSAQQFVNAGIVARRAHAPVPRAGAAPRSAGWSARIRAGAFGTIAPPPPGLNERVFTVRRGSWN